MNDQNEHPALEERITHLLSRKADEVRSVTSLIDTSRQHGRRLRTRRRLAVAVACLALVVAAPAGLAQLNVVRTIGSVSLGPADTSQETGPRLVDHTGMVLDSAFRFDIESVSEDLEESAALDNRGIDVRAAPDGWDLRVVWRSEPCLDRPTVEVSGSSGRITRIVVDPGPFPEFDGPTACPKPGIVHAVDIKASPAPGPNVQVVLKERTRGR
jgi:hypothetical protein